MRQIDKELDHGSWSREDDDHPAIGGKHRPFPAAKSRTGQQYLKLVQRVLDGIADGCGLDQMDAYLWLPMDLATRDQKRECADILKLRAEIEDVVRDVAQALLGAEVDIRYPPKRQEYIDYLKDSIEPTKCESAVETYSLRVEDDNVQPA